MPISPRLVTVLLSLLSLLSAFLLFQVQPVISKFILPWFGGSPGVWTTCMLFFQVLLFGGYAYAHALQMLPRRAQWLVHGVLVLAALAVLPIAPSADWKPAGGADPVGRILLLLLANVALPYFVLSSTSPLVQVWFFRANAGGNPWRLYALSNIGSLVALLSYPFFFEARFDLMQQTHGWSWAFVGFAMLSLFLAFRDRRAAEQSTEPPALPRGAAPPWWQRALWVLLPALASMMLLGATNHVTQDVAVIPLLWVVPLSLYLITFIICFEHPRWYQPWLWALPALPVLALAASYHEIPDVWLDKSQMLLAIFKWFHITGDPSDVLINSYKSQLVICFSAMFLACMVCHGELTRLKPAPNRLTEFYLLMSLGGALGGLLVNLVAPHVFTTYMEWPIALSVCFILVVIASVVRSARWGRSYGLAIVMMCIGAELIKCAVNRMISGHETRGMFFVLAAFIILTLIACITAFLLALGRLALSRAFARSRLTLALCFSVVGVLTAGIVSTHDWWGYKVEPRLERLRNFYGAVSVEETFDAEQGGKYLEFHHGGIVHGKQWLLPDWREEPLSYYGRHSGVGRALTFLKDKPGARVGVVGMGTATVAAYGKKGDTYRFYDINPDIVRLSRQHFTYANDFEARGGKLEIILGDARLSLEREAPQHFDVLLLDAFAGDSVPVHLLTKEAFEIYKGHMNPDGIIAVHISNRYLTLSPVIEKVAAATGYQTSRIIDPEDDPIDLTDYILVTNNQAFLKANPPDFEGFETKLQVQLWTDQRHNLFEILEKK